MMEHIANYWVFYFVVFLILGYLFAKIISEQTKDLSVFSEAELEKYWRKAIGGNILRVAYQGLMIAVLAAVSLTTQEGSALLIMIGTIFFYAAWVIFSAWRLSRQVLMGWGEARNTSYAQRLIRLAAPHRVRGSNGTFGPNGAVFK